MRYSSVIVSSITQEEMLHSMSFLRLKKILIRVFIIKFYFSVAEVGKKNFATSKATLPDALSVVNVGGFDNIYKLAADPKAELVKIVVDNLRATGGESFSDEGKLEAIVALLQSKGVGFSSVKVDGEWDEVLSIQGKKSSKSQKFVGGKKKAARPSSNFCVKAMNFENTVLTPRGNGTLKANVKVSLQNVD